MKQPTFHGRVLLPLSVYEAARAGDILAMGQILRYYDGYINKLCTRTLYDAPCASGRVHETPLAKQTYPGHPKGQPIRKRRTRRPAGPARPALSYGGFSYAFRKPFWRGFDNLSRLPADHAKKALKWRGFYRPKCVEFYNSCFRLVFFM